MLNALTTKALQIAAGEVGVMESPPGSNAGPRVNLYLAAVGLKPGFAWCAAFLYWCFEQASDELDLLNPVTRTAGCLAHWNNTTGERIPIEQALKDPVNLAGSIFIMSFHTKTGAGHTGLVEKVAGKMLHTIEGNTNEMGSREGVGVFRRRRALSSISKGFIEYRPELGEVD